MRRSSTPPDQNVEIRCPRLGQQIHFAYCRTENQGLPCFKALDCWFHHFLVENYFRENLSVEEWKKAFDPPPKPKILSLVEMIEAAKNRKQQGA